MEKPMRARLGFRGLGLCALVALAACGRLAGDEKKPPQLMNIKSASRSPDEFNILPTKPLQMPEDIASLPEPTPINRSTRACHTLPSRCTNQASRCGHSAK